MLIIHSSDSNLYSDEQKILHFMKTLYFRFRLISMCENSEKTIIFNFSYSIGYIETKELRLIYKKEKVLDVSNSISDLAYYFEIFELDDNDKISSLYSEVFVFIKDDERILIAFEKDTILENKKGAFFVNLYETDTYCFERSRVFSKENLISLIGMEKYDFCLNHFIDNSNLKLKSIFLKNI